MFNEKVKITKNVKVYTNYGPSTDLTCLGSSSTKTREEGRDRWPWPAMPTPLRRNTPLGCSWAMAPWP